MLMFALTYAAGHSRFLIQLQPTAVASTVSPIISSQRVSNLLEQMNHYEKVKLT